MGPATLITVTDAEAGPASLTMVTDTDTGPASLTAVADADQDGVSSCCFPSWHGSDAARDGDAWEMGRCRGLCRLSGTAGVPAQWAEGMFPCIAPTCAFLRVQVISQSA